MGCSLKSMIKKTKGRFFRHGGQANLFRMYEDKPMYYDNWDIDIYYTEKCWDADQVERLEWTEVGTLRATLEIRSQELAIP
jgi:alpha-mannosidase